MKDTREVTKDAAAEAAAQLGGRNAEGVSGMAKRTFTGNMQIKDVLGLSDEMVEGIYGQAYLLYNTGKYRDASEVFRLLIMMKSTEPKFMMGLAACYHMLKEYDPAASTYILCSVLDPTSPLPQFHASDCYIQMGDKASAIVALEMTIKRAETKPEYQVLKERAAITLEGLKKELARP